MVAPRTWRKDRHFNITPAIAKARKLIHPDKRNVDVSSWRVPYIRTLHYDLYDYVGMQAVRI